MILANGHRMMVLPAEGCAARSEPGDLVRIELTPHERVGWRLAPRVSLERGV
ncbi:hypothetical protein [Brevundimonas sp. M20]|uniref:hypothetical protein n=1 Tax=Brevundimonas sp. M20 TaxID=2591463 RepID=UPI00143D3958|nr:hypothetical protein [Brevundimonas sp. M20]